tara:strand:+ start:368 stop:754 length:387 start_codon:yes stop_codon:yes gene_type:complete
MADTKVSDLNSITVADNNDVLYIIDTSTDTSKKITFQNLLSGVDTRVTDIDAKVTNFTNEVLILSAQFGAANIDVAPIASDVFKLSGTVDALSAEVKELPTFAPGVSGSFVISASTFTFQSGQLISVT